MPLEWLLGKYSLRGTQRSAMARGFFDSRGQRAIGGLAAAGSVLMFIVLASLSRGRHAVLEDDTRVGLRTLERRHDRIVARQTALLQGEKRFSRCNDGQLYLAGSSDIVEIGCSAIEPESALPSALAQQSKIKDEHQDWCEKWCLPEKTPHMLCDSCLDPYFPEYMQKMKDSEKFVESGFGINIPGLSKNVLAQKDDVMDGGKAQVGVPSSVLSKDVSKLQDSTSHQNREAKVQSLAIDMAPMEPLVRGTNIPQARNIPREQKTTTGTPILAGHARATSLRKTGRGWGSGQVVGRGPYGPGLAQGARVHEPAFGQDVMGSGFLKPQVLRGSRRAGRQNMMDRKFRRPVSVRSAEADVDRDIHRLRKDESVLAQARVMRDFTRGRGHDSARDTRQRQRSEERGMFRETGGQRQSDSSRRLAYNAAARWYSQIVQSHQSDSALGDIKGTEIGFGGKQGGSLGYAYRDGIRRIEGARRVEMPPVAMRQSNKGQGKIMMLAGKIREQKQSQSTEATSHGRLLVVPHPQRAASAHQEDNFLQKQKARKQAQIVSQQSDSQGSKNDRAKCYGFSDCFSSWFLDGGTQSSVHVSQQKSLADRTLEMPRSKKGLHGAIKGGTRLAKPQGNEGGWNADSLFESFRNVLGHGLYDDTVSAQTLAQKGGLEGGSGVLGWYDDETVPQKASHENIAKATLYPPIAKLGSTVSDAVDSVVGAAQIIHGVASDRPTSAGHLLSHFGEAGRGMSHIEEDGKGNS